MNTLDLLQPLGWLLSLIGALIAAWAALAWHARRRDSQRYDTDHRAEDATVQRYRACEQDLDYDHIDTAPAKLTPALDGSRLNKRAEAEARRKAAIAEAQWHSPWGL